MPPSRNVRVLAFVLSALVTLLSGCLSSGSTNPPVAVLRADPTVQVGVTFTLDGSASTADADQTIRQYSWVNLDAGDLEDFPRNTTIETTSSGLEVRFVPGTSLPPGQYRFQLTVTDNAGNHSQPAQVSVTVIAASNTQAPTAVLHLPSTAQVGVPFRLDGGASTAAADLTILRYSWFNFDADNLEGFPRNSSVETTTPQLDLRFLAATSLAPGRYQFRLTVTDTSGAQSQPAIASVVVIDTHQPTAVLDAPATVAVGEIIALSGLRSSVPPPALITRYRWTALTAGFSNLPLNVETETTEPSLNVIPDSAAPGAPGRHTFRLVVVSDSGNESAPALSSVVVRNTQAPTAILDGPATVAVSQGSFTLSGARSIASASARLASYRLTNVNCSGLAGWAPGETRNPATGSVTVGPASAQFVPARCDFSLVVVDDSGNESPPDIRRVAFFDDQAPTAILDGPASVPLQQRSFTLSGARSFDVGGTVTGYRFTNIDCPVLDAWPIGSVITQASPSLPVSASGSSNFAVGRCDFSLLVVDESGNESQPDVRRVFFTDDQQPTAILDGPTSVPLLQGSFTLSGSRSFDVGGSIAEYRFTNLDCPALDVWPVGSVITRASASLTVSANAGANFQSGRCDFSLVVVDDSGNESQPDRRRVVFAQ